MWPSYVPSDTSLREHEWLTLLQNPKLRAFIKSELEKKVVKDYKFDEAPLEYNTWLVFRRIVDLILMCDFTSYMCFAIACTSKPADEWIFTTIVRWLAAAAVFALNVWIKLDAHRVVKDYAWYWGDFFFLVDQQLIFDGVFEMAPHPMYTIGYVGFYGISLAAASYKVLFLSMFGHAMQFAFLQMVENPHIDKIYNAPPPKKQLHEPPQNATSVSRPRTPRTDTAAAWPNPGMNKPPQTHPTLDLDLYRVTDTSTMIIQVLVFLLTIVTPRTPVYKTLFTIAAVVGRSWFSLGIGFLLNRQSEKKKWTRHFIRVGESTGEAWRQWKGTYHMSMIMCYATFAAAAWKNYSPPEVWGEGLVLLKHTIGIGLVALQLWVAFSVYDQLGEYGWFYGDFFFDHSPKLTYGGIYRFLNNPERLLGLAGLWGASLITNSKTVFCLAVFSQILGWIQLEAVERPHMEKLYGRHIRQDSGLSKSLKRSLPPPLSQWQEKLETNAEKLVENIEEFLDAAKPQIEAKIEEVVGPTKDWLANRPATIGTVRRESDDSDIDKDLYSLEIIDEGRTDNVNGSDSILQLEFGAPIKVGWVAPAAHSKKDWIGIYSLASRNASRKITTVSSQGRWTATNGGEYDDLTPEQGIISSDQPLQARNQEDNALVTGEIVFAGDKLWWEQGIFEFRFHHNGKHTVMAISQPFEIRIPRFKEEDLDLLDDISGQSLGSAHNEELIRRAIETVLLPVVQNCFERNPDHAPSTPQETFGGLIERDGKYARRVVYAIQRMFGIDFAPQVVKADGQVSNLAWRILEAEKVLQPYSMSKSRGTTTPVG